MAKPNQPVARGSFGRHARSIRMERGVYQTGCATRSNHARRSWECCARTARCWSARQRGVALYRDLVRDGKVFACLQSASSLVSKPWQVEPQVKDSPKASAIRQP